MNNILPTISIRWLVFLYQFLGRRGEKIEKNTGCLLRKSDVLV
nr:MAG TPA: hypothetical protein [Caudoviricetes sp.]